MDEEKTLPSLSNISVKKELEDDFSSIDTDSKLNIKPSSSTSGDYDEWLEIQKELGVYPSAGDSSKCKNINISGSVGGGTGGSASVTGTIIRPSRMERTRNNGESRTTNTSSAVSVQSASSKNIFESDSSMELDRRWCSSATELERDLLEDADSLDELAFHSQVQCPSALSGEVDNSNILEHDDITAQVQSAIDSILNLKKMPSSSTATSGASGSTAQTSESKDSVLDQAVRSILGS